MLNRDSIVTLVALSAICIGVISTISIVCLYDSVVKELKESYPDVWSQTGSFQPWSKEVSKVWSSILKSRHVPMGDFAQKGGLPLNQLIKQEAVYRKLLPASAPVLTKIRIMKCVFTGTFIFAFISVLVIFVFAS